MFTEKTILNCIFTWGVLAALVVFMGLSGASRATAQIGAPKGLNVLTKINVNAYGFEVRTVYPSKVQGQVSFSKVAWNCQGNICTTQVKYPGFGVSACHALAMKVGAIHSFRLTKQPRTVAPVKGYPLNADQIARCNQGISSPKKMKVNTHLGVSALNTPIAGNANAVGQGAQRAKTIGEAGSRMKQAKALQRLHDLGTPQDQAMGGGAAAGGQDCSHSADRAKCLQDNMNAGKAPSAASGGGMRECIMGANPQNCFNRGRSNRPGTLSAGPGDPRDQVKDPRGMAADDGDGSITVGEYHSGAVRVQGGWQTRMHDGQVVRRRYLADENGDEIIETVTYSDDGTSSHAANVHHQDGSEDIYVVELNNLDREESSTHTHMRARGGAGASGQAAPDTASGGAADHCNRDLVTGRCKNPRPDPQGNTSQPGPDGENTGGILGHNTPKTDVGAAINCGDASAEACNRAGAGLSSGAQPLEHTDPGPTPGGAPH